MLQDRVTRQKKNLRLGSMTWRDSHYVTALYFVLQDFVAPHKTYGLFAIPRTVESLSTTTCMVEKRCAALAPILTYTDDTAMLSECFVTDSPIHLLSDPQTLVPNNGSLFNTRPRGHNLNIIGTGPLVVRIALLSKEVRASRPYASA